MIFKKIKNTLWFVFVSVLLLIYQNCSGDLGGIVVGNPLRIDPEKLTITLNKFEAPGTSATMCFRKVKLIIDELYGPTPVIPDDQDGVTVGRIIDLNGSQVGNMDYGVDREGNEMLISAWGQLHGGQATLTDAADVYLYQLDIPDGRYSYAEFVVGEDSCPDIPAGNSLLVMNPFGVFNSHSFFQFNINTAFEVIDGKSSMQKLNTSDFFNDISQVQSNEELLNTLIDKEYE